jgi:hypothetical protein
MVSIRAAGALLLACGLGWGQAAPVPLPAAEVARQDQAFAAAQAGTRSFRAELRQTLTLEGLDQPVVSMGELSYLAPDRLSIKFSQPAGEWMRIEGKQFTLQKKGQPLQHRDLAASGNANAATLLDFFGGDPRRWHRDFDVAMARDGDRLLVTLVPWRVPTAQRQGVDRIVTTLRLPGYDVEKIEVTIHGANRLEFAFTRGQRNAKIDPALFTAP